jgi:non-heme chloroperoxidase
VAAASSWDRWAALFEDNGYATLTPGWPDDPETVEEAAEHPEVFAGKSTGQVADQFGTIIRGLERKPAIIGHRPVPLRRHRGRSQGCTSSSVHREPAVNASRSAGRPV